MSRPDYEAIAVLYDVDMARNMPFDDIGFYSQLCRRHGGRVLELGCGNGRILSPLLERGVDAIGVDASAGMLRGVQRNARSCIAQMDVRSLAFARAFELVLCPYSLITYMAHTEDAQRLLREVRGILVPRGCVVVDAFVPRPGVPSAGFRLDYRRPWGDGTLERAKRVTPLAPRQNRIERRYRILARDQTLMKEIETSEEIQLFVPEELVALVEQCGFTIEERWWDYSSRVATDDAQFFTLVARSRD